MIEFRYLVDMLTVGTPSSGYAVAYDLDGILKQKDIFGVITIIGGSSSGPTGSAGATGSTGATGSSGATPSLSQVLVVDNTTGFRDIIMGETQSILSATGTGFLSLSQYGVMDYVGIGVDAFNSITFVKGPTVPTSYTTLNGENILYLYSTYDKVVIKSLSGFATFGTGIDADIIVSSGLTESSHDNTPRSPVFISTQNSTVNALVSNSALIGGYGLIATESNTVYLGNYVNINNAYTLPSVDGTSNQVLKTDGSGSLTWSTISSGTASANNGLTESGGVIKLGGSLVQNTLISNATHSFTMSSTSDIYFKTIDGSGFAQTKLSVEDISGTVSSIVIQVPYSYISSTNISNTTSVLVSPGYLSLDTGTEVITMWTSNQATSDGSTNNRMIITDGTNAKGLVYAGSYSANFTTYSLVTKEYVDSRSSVITDKITATAGDVQNIFTTPKQLIAAPGTGKYIEILSVQGSIPNGSAYASNTDLSIIYAGQSIGVFTDQTLLLSDAAALIAYFSPPAIFPNGSAILSNTAVQLTELVGNPTGGNFGVDIYITYIIRTL